MRFIYPSFLWALLLIAIPIIIHLVNLRRHKTVYFSNVNLLKRVQKETKRKSKLKQLLILASRILLISALVFAFAQPYIPTGNAEKQQANKVVGLYIDNSFSMNAEGPEGKAIESAKQKAFAIVNGSQANTKFALITNAMNEQQNRFYSRSEIIRLISETTVEHNSKLMSTVLLRFTNMMENFLLETDKTIYIISDFQKHSSDLAELAADSVITYNFVPIPVNEVSNIYIDTCWFDAPTHHFNQKEVLNVRLVNQSSSDYPQLPVNFYMNDSLKALASTTLLAGESKTISLQYTNLKKGVQMGRIEISDYPITYDNNLYLSYHVKSELNALLIQSNANISATNLKALFSNDEFINLDIERSDRLLISSLGNYSTIFLNELKTISSGLAGELKQYVESGGTLLIIPNLLSDTESYNQFLASMDLAKLSEADTVKIPISGIDYEHSLYAEVFKDKNQKVAVPNVKYRYRFENNQQVTETQILSFADQSSALSLKQLGAGKVFLLAFPLSIEENEFTQHLLFLPTFYNMVLQSTFAQKIYYTLGENQFFELKIPDQSLSQNLFLKHLQSGEELIPSIVQQRGNTLSLSANGDFDAGFYESYFGSEKVGGFAFNYLLQESDLVYYSTNEIEDLSKTAGIARVNVVAGNSQNMAAEIADLDNGKQLWKLFILIGLFFLLIEGAIIRLWPS